jgi:hypothetical protein
MIHTRHGSERRSVKHSTVIRQLAVPHAVREVQITHAELPEVPAYLGQPRRLRAPTTVRIAELHGGRHEHGR